MNEVVLQLLNDESFKNSCYAKAQKMIDSAGLKGIEVDKSQFNVRPDNKGNMHIRIAVKKFTKHTVDSMTVRALKRIPEYRPVYDRYKRIPPFEERQLFEWGYIELEYQPLNNH